MQKSRGWMRQFAVLNRVTDQGTDDRKILIDLGVPTRSGVAMALCALEGQPATLTLKIQPAPGDVGVEIEMAVKIAPGWKPDKNRSIQFTVVADFTARRVLDLVEFTTTMPVVVGLDLAQVEMDLDPVQSALQSFVRGMGASGGGSITAGGRTVEIPDDPGARFVMGEDGDRIERQVLAGELVPLEDLSDDELEEIGLTVGETAAWHAANGGAELAGQDKAAHGRAVKKLTAAGYAV